MYYAVIQRLYEQTGTEAGKLRDGVDGKFV